MPSAKLKSAGKFIRLLPWEFQRGQAFTWESLRAASERYRKNRAGPTGGAVLSRLSLRHRRKLGYRMGIMGFGEAILYLLQIQNWWSRSGSNRRPRRCERRALSTELLPPKRRMLLEDALPGVKQNFVPVLPACPARLIAAAKKAQTLLLQPVVVEENRTPTPLT